MVFQPILAGSGNVDIVYGPDDYIPIIILNLGEERIVDLILKIKKPDGTMLENKIFKGIPLSQGRTMTYVAKWKPKLEKEGYYIFDYEVCEEK